MPTPVSEKDKHIASVFYHPKTGFGSIEQTFQAARKLDATINRNDIREFLAKQEVRQRHKPHKVNSFVPMFPRQEFQVDLLDMGAKAVPRYGFTAVDIFTKKGACIPIRSKLAKDTAAALRTVFEELGYPSSIMCDEGGEFLGEFAAECKKQDVEIIQSRTGGRFVERFIRTLKKPLFERVKSLGGNWRQYVRDVVDNYNDKVHSSIDDKPTHVADNEYDYPIIEHAHETMLKQAKFPTRHSEINVGDHVKVRVKQGGFYKETFNSWSDDVYTVRSIDAEAPQGKVYHLEDYRRPLLRFELKKVDDVQRYKPGAGLRSALHKVKRAAVVAAAQAELAAFAAPPRPPPRPAPVVAAANLRAAGGHRMVTRSMRAPGPIEID
jgi:hypothetical protein